MCLSKIAVIATLDTKGDIAKYLADGIRKKGCVVITIDGGIQGHPFFQPDITREDIARAAGFTMEKIYRIKEEGKALQVMARGITQILDTFLKGGTLGGVVGVGGGMGTSLGTSVMKNLPFGVPKLMVSTMAGGNVRPFVGTKDIMMFHTVADLVGLNRITRSVLDRAAGAAVGMIPAGGKSQLPGQNPIGFSTIGGTEACVRKCMSLLKAKHVEAVVYHTNGTGGMALEDAMREGLLSGVIEVSIRELIDHLFGGVCDGGSQRFNWSGGEDVPKIIIPGGVDFVTMGPAHELPEQYRNRQYHVHHHAITLVRTDYEELDLIAKVLADKVNRFDDKTVVISPRLGFSSHDNEGRHFFDMKKNKYFVDRLKHYLKDHVKVEDVDAHINDDVFAAQVVKAAVRLFGL